MADINEDDGIDDDDIEEDGFWDDDIEDATNRSKFKIFPDGEVDPLDGDTTNFLEFDWEHVRTWMKLRRNIKFTGIQIKEMASQDVVMLEKANGVKPPSKGGCGSVEKGTLVAAKRIKQVNPKVKILFYLNAMVHYEDYDANKSWKPEWALRYTGTGELVKWRNRFPSYNHFNLEFREWWIQRALAMTADDNIDGVFIDGICKVGNRKLCPPNHEKEYLETANELRRRLQPGEILIGNAVRAAKKFQRRKNWLRWKPQSPQQADFASS